MVSEAPQYTTVQTHAFERTIANVKREELKFYALDLRKGTFESEGEINFLVGVRKFLRKGQ